MTKTKQNIHSLYYDYSEKSIKYKNYFSNINSAKSPFEKIWLFLHHISEINLAIDIQKDITFFLSLNNTKATEEEKRHLISAIYREHLKILSIDYSSNLEVILYENLLVHTKILMQQGLPILRNEKLISIAPLIFSHTHWKRIIKHDLSLIENASHKEIIISDYLSNISKLMGEFDLNNSAILNKFNSLALEQIKQSFKVKNDIFKFFDVKNLGKKKEYLIELSSANIPLKSSNKRALNQELKIELANPKNIRKIRKGLNYLIKKQNPNLTSKESKSIARIISSDIFQTENPEVYKPLYNRSINFNNKVLMEFIFFLSKNQYIKKQGHSFPKIISNNLSIHQRGFSYQNLYILAKKIESDSELTFNGLTSSLALENEMKY